MFGFKLHYTPKDLEKATGRSGRVIRARLRRTIPTGNLPTLNIKQK